MVSRFNSRKPRYNDDSDYTTNAPSYYDDIARKQKLIKELSLRIWEYDKTLAESLENIENVLNEYINIVDGKIELIDQKIGEDFNDEINNLLVEWVNDGTLDHIINETLMNKKADIIYVDDHLSEINKNLNERELNVKTLGAKGDGTDSDSEFINLGIDILNGMGGGTLRFPHGVYKLGETFSKKISDNINIVGSGKGTILDGSNLPSGSHGAVIGGEYEENIARMIGQNGNVITFEGSASLFNVGDIISITSNERRSNTTDYVKEELATIKRVYTNTLELESSMIEKYTTLGYDIQISKVLPLKNLVLKDFTLKMEGVQNADNKGLQIVNFTDLVIDNVCVVGADRQGIRVDRGYRATTVNCHVVGSNYDTRGYGIYYSRVHGGTITKNYGNDNRHSIEVGSGVDIIISKNIINDNLQGQAISTHGGTKRIIIESNIITNCRGGVRNRGDETTIRNNQMYNIHGNAGITIGEIGSNDSRDGIAGKKLIIEGNIIDGVEHHGIHIYDALENASITQNKILNYDWGGMLINGHHTHNTIIDHNIIKTSSQNSVNAGSSIKINPSGVGVQGRNIKNTTINNNIIDSKKATSSSNRDGIFLEDASSRIIYGDDDISSSVQILDNIINASARSIQFGSSGEFRDLSVRDNKGTSITGPFHLDGTVLPLDNIDLSYHEGMFRNTEFITPNTIDGSVNISFYPCIKEPSLSLTPRYTLPSIAIRSDWIKDEDGYFIGAELQLFQIDGREISGSRIYVKIDYKLDVRNL